MKLIDTHTHIYVEEFDGDRDEAVARALGAGVDTMMCPAIDLASYGRMLELCGRYPTNCLPMMGLHPTSVNDNPRWREELALAEEYLRGAAENAAGKTTADGVADGTSVKFYAVGEVGLDLYWSKEWRREQEEAFVRQIELSLQYGLPLVIHTREAWPEMLAILRRFGQSTRHPHTQPHPHQPQHHTQSALKGIMHSFSGTLEDYHAVKECGDFLFGIGGPVTYKKSALRETVAAIPLSDIVLETDSPYLTPSPFRGRRNESSYLTYICEKVAEIKGLHPDEVAAATTANAVRMFSLPQIENGKWKIEN